MGKSDAATRRIGQIAVVMSDHGRSCDFYARVFALDHVFGTSAFRGEMAEKIQGVKNAASTTDWLIDDRERFQLEVFQYEYPCSRPLAADRSISDVGYNRIIAAVESLAETSRRAAEAGASVVPLPLQWQFCRALTCTHQGSGRNPAGNSGGTGVGTWTAGRPDNRPGHYHR